MTAGGIDALRELLREEGGALAATLAPAPRSPAGVDAGALAAAGPRVAAHQDEAALAVAAVQEGSRLHYGAPIALDIDDPDLALLAGDRLYALGLERLASAGDLAAIAELADVIALVAQAHAAGDGELAEAVWQLGAAAIGWGATAQSAEAKARVRAGDGTAAQALRIAARTLTAG